jgi:predicted dehydrogenase/threonine dehydrogenase-like Zn-dependent dehydrogenase
LKQILQNIQDGRIEVAEIPCPAIKPEHLLIATKQTLISAGTEKMLLEFGRAGWVNKARQQPDKVRQVLDKMKTDGILPTFDAVKSKLEKPLPLGYANVGTVVESAASCTVGTPFKIGDRVVSNGYHAGSVCVPRNLCARVPDSVSDREAAFTVPGAIALQGIRLVKPEIGETVVVTGLGLLGLITVQLLVANGCRVIGLDPDQGRCNLARQFGAEDAFFADTAGIAARAMEMTAGRGVDAVIIAAATPSSEPVHQAARLCRKKGRIILVGVTGLELQRADFYEKELSFQVSCSYGPGRYDSEYEEKGHDYPYGHVRWTIQRNFETVLEMMRAGKLDIVPLITHEFPVEDAVKAYEIIATGNEAYLGILLQYDSGDTAKSQSVDLITGQPNSSARSNRSVIGMLGAGNFTGRILLPALVKTDCDLKTIVSSGGVSGTLLGRKFGFQSSGTDSSDVFNDAEINTVFITTRHNSHADFMLKAIAAGKHVFCEKPLCLNMTELEEIDNAYQQSRNKPGAHPVLMVGFNRRFSPLVRKIKALLAKRSSPVCMLMNVNAGVIPAEHWTQDAHVGGGRVIGEACHFIDLLFFLCGASIISKNVAVMGDRSRDTFSIQLGFADGSIGTVNYFSNGNNAYPKEKLQVYCAGKVLEMDNFRRLIAWGWPGFKKEKLWRQDKGHAAELEQFISAITNGTAAPIAFKDILEVTRHTIELAAAVSQGAAAG